MIAEAIIAEDIGTSFSTKKEHGIIARRRFFQDGADMIASKPIVSYKEECDQHLSIPAVSARSDPLVWWQQNENTFPHIAKMARQYLGVPATCASVEGVFSGVDLTFADLRKK